MKSYPNIKWLNSALRNNLQKPVRRKILNAYIIGSYAKGTNSKNSDLDIAIIISPIKKLTSLQYSNLYHTYFINENQRIKWNDVIVDIQFFYPNDAELENYIKIELT